MKPWKVAAHFASLALAPAIILCSCSKHPAAPESIAPPQAPASVPSQSDSVAGADVSSPKKTSLAFASAIVAGDVPAMRSLAVGTGGHLFSYYGGLAGLVASQHIFMETLTAKFGDACKVPEQIEHIGNLPPMPANYDKLTERIDGDSAILVDENGHAGVKLRKVDGNWKVDFDATDAALPPDAPANLDAQLKEFEALQKVFNQATAKIIDGTYTDCQAALDAVASAMTPPPAK